MFFTLRHSTILAIQAFTSAQINWAAYRPPSHEIICIQTRHGFNSSKNEKRFRCIFHEKWLCYFWVSMIVMNNVATFPCSHAPPLPYTFLQAKYFIYFVCSSNSPSSLIRHFPDSLPVLGMRRGFISVAPYTSPSLETDDFRLNGRYPSSPTRWPDYINCGAK